MANQYFSDSVQNESSRIFCITPPNEMIPCAGDEEDKNGVLEIETPFPSFFLLKSRNRVSEKLPERGFCFVTLK